MFHFVCCKYNNRQGNNLYITHIYHSLTRFGKQSNNRFRNVRIVLEKHIYHWRQIRKSPIWFIIRENWTAKQIWKKFYHVPTKRRCRT